MGISDICDVNLLHEYMGCMGTKVLIQSDCCNSNTASKGWVKMQKSMLMQGALVREVTNWCSVQGTIVGENLWQWLRLVSGFDQETLFWRQFRVAFSTINCPLSLTARLGPAGPWILHKLILTTYSFKCGWYLAYCYTIFLSYLGFKYRWSTQKSKYQ